LLPPELLNNNLSSCIIALKNKGYALDSQQFNQLATLRKQAIVACQSLQEQRNTLSKEVGQKKARQENCQPLIKKINTINEQLTIALAQEKDAQENWHHLMLNLPNLPAKNTPIGKDEQDNKVLRTWGTPKKFSFAPKDHIALGKIMTNLSLEQGAQLSGARFAVLQGPIAKLHRKLAQFMLEIHTEEHGYTEINPPLLVKQKALFGTGQLPKFKDDLFLIQDETLALIPTAEVPLTNLYLGAKPLPTKELPLKFVAHTPCFRREAGSYGKDTHGFLRMHQFEKVELVQITTEEQALEAHQAILQQAETILQRLELPYRVVELCTGDLGFSANRTYDLEVWLPSQQTYREISSISHCDTFQARRMGTRHKSNPKEAAQYVHTLNGSGLAVGRTLIAVLENHQCADGTITLPKALLEIY
jgi:seryl-tRNA synthetase